MTHKRRGRPAQRTETRSVSVTATVEPSLKFWLFQQPEGASALIYRLLHEERIRREKEQVNDYPQ